jgi:alpha-beta hydrolase superfamily lysophospholipase
VNHSLAHDLREGKGSKAYWAKSPCRHALVFVHGFRGKALKTWRDFPRLLLQDPGFEGWDLVFFGYKSAKRQAVKSAEEFQGFFERFATSPGSLMTRTGDAAGDRPISGGGPYYERIFVVAHSLGAAVVRYALVRNQADAVWAPCVHLVFYAPAHAGARDVDALVNAVGDEVPGARFFLSLKLYRMPVVDDLTGKTNFLQQLLSRTKQRLASRLADHLIARAIVDAEFEYVVKQDKFIDEDPDGRMIPGTNHSSVCKPKPRRLFRGSFLEPYDRLKELI